MRGALITIEGADCTGKSTQARLLADALAASGRPTLLTREPGGAPGAEKLRTFLLSSGTRLAPFTEALLHFAARTEHTEQTLRPALAAGFTIVCDRFFDSTMAYQGYGQGADRAAIAALIHLLNLSPRLTFILDLPPGLERERLALRHLPPDRYERLGPHFLNRVHAGFHAIAAANPERCILIDAAPDAAAVHARIFAIAKARLA